MVDTTSVALLNRVQDAADNDAWSQFDGIYRNFIVRFLSSREIDHDVGEDICQSVMKQVYEALSSGGFTHNGRKGAFRYWLRRVVVSQLGLHRRKNQRHEHPLPEELDEHLAKDDSRLLRLWDREHNKALLEVVMELLRVKTPPESLEIFRQTFVEGASAEQVAEQFGRTKNAIVVVKCKILKQARELAGDLLN